jgi:hypothetical protein
MEEVDLGNSVGTGTPPKFDNLFRAFGRDEFIAEAHGER